MDASLFAERLLRLAPSIEELRQDGLDDHAIDRIRRSFIAKRTTVSAAAGTNPIIALVKEYDLTTVEIGLITFMSDTKHLNGRTAFGNVESDLLCLDDKTGVICLLDHSSPTYVICECALNASCFLDALLIGASNTTSVEACILAAGGERFRQFFEAVLGWQ